MTIFCLRRCSALGPSMCPDVPHCPKGGRGMRGTSGGEKAGKNLGERFDRGKKDG
jgi:hypothetical protein